MEIQDLVNSVPEDKTKIKDKNNHYIYNNNSFNIKKKILS